MAGRHPNACLKSHMLQLLSQLPRRLECVAGRIGQCNRCPKHRQCRIPLKLINNPLISVYYRNHMFEKLIQLHHHLLRLMGHGKRGRANHIHENDRHLPILAPQLWALLQGASSHLHAHIPAKNIPHPLPLLQPPHHLVKTGL